jgi:DNA-directed RNA polymerase subunit RPC12/RpoP
MIKRHERGKRRCKKCRQLRDVVNFSYKNRGTKYEGWCIICRRKAGIDIDKRGRPGRDKKRDNSRVYQCMKCDELFESEVWGENNQHYHLCPHCRKLIDCMEQVSI